MCLLINGGWIGAHVERGMPYFVAIPIQGLLIVINSHKLLDDSNSFLGELKSVSWALQDVKPFVQGRLVVLWIDAESVYKKLTGHSFDPKRMMDKRASIIML